MVYFANLVVPIKNGLKEPLTLVPVITKFEADYDVSGFISV